MTIRHNDRGRHPLFECVVFGFALLLVAILLFYTGRRFLPGRSPAQPPPAGDFPTTGAGPARTSGAGSATESAVTSIAPIKLSRVGNPRAWRVEVPSPTGTKQK